MRTKKTRNTVRYPLEAGTITKLEYHKKYRERFWVYLDEEYRFSVHPDVVLEFRLANGVHLTENEQQALLNEDAWIMGKVITFELLARRSYSIRDIRRKLNQKEIADSAIDRVIAWMVDHDFLNDETYARRFVQRRIKIKGHGSARLRVDLMKKGVDRALIDEIIDEEVNEDDSLEQAFAHAERRWPKLYREADLYKRKIKLSNFLLRRGFGYDIVRQVVDEIAQEI